MTMADIFLYVVPLLAICGAVWTLFDEMKILNRKLETHVHLTLDFEKRLANNMHVNEMELINLEERIEELENDKD